MSRLSRERTLNQRITAMVYEGDRMKGHIESGLDLAIKSVDMLKNVKNNNFSQFFKLLLPKIDEISYLFMNFNDSIEEIKSSQISIFKDITSHLNSDSLIDTKVSNDNENASILSGRLGENESEIEINDIHSEFTNDDIKSEITTVEIDSEHINDEIKSTNIDSELFNDDEIKSDQVANDYWHMKSSTIDNYNEYDEFDCIIVHCEDPYSIFIVPLKYSQEYQNLLIEIGKYHSNSISTGYSNKTEILNTKFSQFVIYDDINEIWCRATINSFLENPPNCVEMISVDTGKKFVVNVTQIYDLDKKFDDLPIYLKKIQLDAVQPFSDSQEKWSEECINYLHDLELKTCSVLVVKILPNSLIVRMTIGNDDISVRMVSKNLVELQIGDDCNDKENIVLESTNNKFDHNHHENYDFEDENIGPDIEVKFDSVNLNDEKILCKFYEGPPHTTCFKGDRCKKIHKLLDKDGLTMERVPTNIISCINLPNCNSVMNVVITYVNTCRNIYVQFLSYEKSTADDYYAKLQTEFQTLEFSMNEPHFIASMKKFDYYPSEGEIVAAFYSKTEMWHRARVISMSQNSVEVFFIDYGYQNEIRLKDIRKLNSKCFEIPQLAIECNVVNIKEEYPNKESEARKYFSNMIFDKKIFAIVKYSQSANNSIGVVLLDDDGFDIGGMLHACGLVNVCNELNDYCFNNEIQIIPG